MSRQQFWRAHKKAVKLAHAKDSSVHDWRHVFAVRLRKMGVPDWKIAKLMGHKNANEVIEVYGPFDPTDDELQVLGSRAAKATAWGSVLHG
jgi:integrase